MKYSPALLFLLVGMACSHGGTSSDSSAFAVAAGQSTLALGDCQGSLNLGYSTCRLTKKQELPTLSIFFTNRATFAISDCELGLFKTGETKEAGVVDIDLSPLQAQLDQNSFCFLRIEAYEYEKDRKIPFSGGYFIEALDPFYPVHPAEFETCFTVRTTSKGRREITSCKP